MIKRDTSVGVTAKSSLPTSADSQYHRRHTKRSEMRAQMLVTCMNPGASVLDIGCNHGITSSHLLNTGVASSVTGVEISRSTVSDSLLANPNFTFVESDVTQLSLAENFDYVVYGAVHHHVLHHHGLTAAVSCLNNLAAHCRKTLFIESGHLVEGSRWPWQQTIRKYFRTDEEHLHYLLSSIEHRVSDFRVIGRHWIHGCRRAYLAIDLEPNDLPQHTGFALLNGKADEKLLEWKSRSFGSRNQTLTSDASTLRESPVLFAEYIDQAPQPLFLKRHVHRPMAAPLEAGIGKQLPFDWAVKPMPEGTCGDTLVFSCIKGYIRISDVERVSSEHYPEIAQQVNAIFADMYKYKCTPPRRTLFGSTKPYRLASLCDLNPNNILIVLESGRPNLKVVDFEFFSTENYWRNLQHWSAILLSMKLFRAQAIGLLVVARLAISNRLFVDQFRSLEWRIRHRRPSLLSLILVEARVRLGSFEQWLAHALRSE